MKKAFAFLLMLCHFLPVFSQVEQQLAKAKKALDNEQYKVAAFLFGEVIKSRDPQWKHIAYYYRGDCYYEMAEYKKAKADFKKCLKTQKHNRSYTWIMQSAYWMLGRVYSIQDKKQKSLKMYYKGLDFKKSSLLYSTIAYKEIQMEQYDKAFHNLNLAIEMDSTNAYAYNNRSLVKLRLNDLKGAREDVEKSLELNKYNPYAYKHSALIYIELKDFENACIELEKAKKMGYENFGKEADSQDVDNLIKKYCK